MPDDVDLQLCAPANDEVGVVRLLGTVRDPACLRVGYARRRVHLQT